MVADQHTVTDAGQLFAHGVFNQDRRNILSTGRDQQLCNDALMQTAAVTTAAYTFIFV